MTTAKPMRVGFIMPTEVGWRTQFLNWQNGLTDDLNVEAEWIVINWWREGGLLERLPILPAGAKARIRSRLELRDGLAKGPFDALYAGVGHVLQGGRKFLSKQPYFIATDVTLRQLYDFGDYYGNYPSKFQVIENHKHKDWCERYQNAAAVFACSNWVRESIICDYGAKPENVFVVPPGVDTNSWHVEGRTPHDGPLRLLFVGGDFVRKGGDLLLKWAKTTESENWHLDVVTRDMVSSVPPNVTVHHGLNSNDPQLLQLYRDADLFVLPTRADCHSLASLEAMASGIPVVLSETGGTGDIIRDGETGYLVRAGKYDDLASRLDLLVGNRSLIGPMGEAARRDAVLRFDAKANIRRTIELMRSAMNWT